VARRSGHASEQILGGRRDDVAETEVTSQLMEAIEPLLQQVMGRLVAVDGIQAVVLGGSWASGTQRPDSDVDLGLYYDPSRPIDIPALRAVAEALNDTPNPS
jgi:predicted nucleotidyltransferase